MLVKHYTTGKGDMTNDDRLHMLSAINVAIDDADIPPKTRRRLRRRLANPRTTSRLFEFFERIGLGNGELLKILLPLLLELFDESLGGE